MKHLKILIVLALLPHPAFAIDFGCTYSLDPHSVKIGWTAFKTTEKTGVHGTIKDTNIQTSRKPTKTLAMMLSDTVGQGQINNANKSESGNPTRDETLFQKFFRLVRSYAEYEGHFDSVKGDDHAGTMNLKLKLNGKVNEVPMTYKMGAEGWFEANGTFDMTQFGMDAALASLHTACEELHKGKDGVSKTWPNVELSFTGKVAKDCKK